MNTTVSPRSELQSLRKLGLRAVLVLLPFLLLQLLELFVLPIDFFTFRVWEAALATPYRYPGAFYPNLYVKKKKEYADRYRLGRPEWIEHKSVEWHTDGFGWRNRPAVETASSYEAVVLGDSNIVGSYLDQKATLSEQMMQLGLRNVYSYAYGSDHIGLFFGDSRLKNKAPKLLVIESKAGNWYSTGDYLKNFYRQDDGSLDVVDRAREFADYFYAPGRNPGKEQFESRFAKQAMFHWAKASLSTEFSVSGATSGELIASAPLSSTDAGEGWRPANWTVSNGVFKRDGADLGGKRSAIAFRGTAPNCYWHTDRFVAANTDGKIKVRFEAKNSVGSSKHRFWVFEDGSYRSVGEVKVGNRWQSFEIPVSTNPGSILELQIDQPDAWQWLSVRDFHVIDGKPMPAPTKDLVAAQSTSPAAPETKIAETQALVPAPAVTAPPFTRLENPTSLDGPGKPLTVAESQYYFYHASKALQRRAKERDMDLVLFVMPDNYIGRLLPAIRQLRAEGIKVLAYEPSAQWAVGVDMDWYWQKADSHWTEAAVRLTADEILRMWKSQAVANRPFSTELMSAHADAIPAAKSATVAVPVPAPLVFAAVANTAPNFETGAGWGEGYAKAKGKGPGVVVGPGPEAPNTFAQSFVAKPSEPFKIVAKASSIDKPKAQGRLQINWHGAEGKYISTSSLVIDATPTEKIFEYETVAPSGAATGILYVVAHGAEDKIRYTKMLLLKENNGN